MRGIETEGEGEREKGRYRKKEGGRGMKEERERGRNGEWKKREREACGEVGFEHLSAFLKSFLSHFFFLFPFLSKVDHHHRRHPSSVALRCLHQEVNQGWAHGVHHHRHVVSDLLHQEVCDPEIRDTKWRPRDRNMKIPQKSILDVRVWA